MANEDSKPARDAAPNIDQGVTADAVRTLAAAASLPLAPERVAVVQPILAAWLAESAALNRLMQQDAHREVLPITVLRHRVSDEGAS